MKLKVRSKNTSCAPLKELDTGSRRVIYRMGSTTPTEAITRRHVDLEINSPEACRISGDKRLMKQAFVNFTSPIPTAEFVLGESGIDNIRDFFTRNCQEHGMIIKRYNSSKGNGIYKVDTIEELNAWFDNNTNHHLSNYIFEKYYQYSKEYRLHVTNEGCFYTCRKMLRENAEVRWHRHESNSVWIVEENPNFAKPSNWDEIVEACINAKNAVGLDIAAVDVKCTTWMRDPCKYIILETNSAPALGEIGINKYKAKLTDIISNN